MCHCPSKLRIASSATSKSAVSRKFVAMTETALAELLSQDLSGLDQYLGMSTVSIGESMRFAQLPREASTTKPFEAGSMVLVTIENDLVISNQLAQRVLSQWQANGSQVEEFVFDAKFGLPHDVIDIHQRKANPDLVYPVMIDLVEGRTPLLPSLGQ